MPLYKTQQDLLDYISQLERRIEILEKSAVRVDVINQIDPVPSWPKAKPTAGRIVYFTPAAKLYAADGTSWYALW